MSKWGAGSVDIIDLVARRNVSHTQQYGSVLEHMYGLHVKLQRSCVAVLVLEDDAAAATDYQADLSRALAQLYAQDREWIWLKLWLGVSSTK